MYGQLRDIHGLDSIPWWPLASGWWIGAALLLLILVAILLLVRHLIIFPPGSWRKEARAALRELRRHSPERTSKETAGRLSELLRRIAIARFGREGPASMTGEQWLSWLQQEDPNGFNWSIHGKLLLSLPYAPEDWQADPGEIRTLIRATQEMVGSSREDASRPPRRWRLGRNV